MHFVLPALVGFIAGMVSGLFGGGSGLITVPGFYWLLVHTYPNAHHLMQVTIATGTTLGAIFGVVASYRQYRYRQVDFERLKTTLGWIVLGSLVGCVIVSILHSEILKIIFGVGILIMAVWFANYQPGVDKPWNLKPWLRRLVEIMVGTLAIILGTSIFAAPYLVKSGLPMRKAVGTSTIIVFSYCVVGIIFLLILGLNAQGLPSNDFGYINFPILSLAVIPSILGAMLGAKLTTYFSQSTLKKLFVGMMVTVALSMLL